MKSIVFSRVFNRLAIFLLTVGGVLLTASSVDYSTSGLPGDDSALTKFWLLIAGVITLLVAGSMLVIRWSFWTISYFATRFVRSLPDFFDPKIDVKPAGSADLKRIYKIGENLFEGGVSSLSSMKRWHSINPNIFWIVKVKRANQPDLVKGYFCVVPLTKKAVNLLRTGEISGKNFTTDHIYKSPRPHTIYIGGMAADGRRPRAALIYSLRHHIQLLVQSSLTHIYANPVTPDGVKLVEKYDFEQVTSGQDRKGSLHFKLASEL